MSEYHQQKPPTPPTPPPPPPPAPPCPDPCDQDRPYGPPPINPECCPKDPPCCGDGDDKKPAPCAWGEVDDPCVRASSAGCGYPWTKLTCKCESSSDCGCDEWECPTDVMCVPCKPCDGLIPDPETPGDGGGDEPNDDCSSDALRQQLEANTRRISAQQAEQARITADIAARTERSTALAALIKDFDGIIDKYKSERYKLTCREDCLKGFYRDVAKALAAEFPPECLKSMETAINAELCALEKAKCCQKNLEWKLKKDTRLVCAQAEAEKALKSAEDAFGFIKDLSKWIGERFTELEKVKDQIAAALNDKDPQKHRFAFYLFYWVFVPGLCRRYRVAICCPPDERTDKGGCPPPSVHIGCEPGDWHPSQISPEDLTKLICCAWEFVRTQKEAAQAAKAAVDAVTGNLAYVKKAIETATSGLEDRIRRQIEKVACAPAATSSRW